jgi:integrase/recombinase XerC
MADEYRSKDPMIDKWITYLRLDRGRAALTCEGYARDVEQFARSFGVDGFARLPTVTEDDIRSFIRSLTQDDIHSYVTVRRKLAAIRTFYAWLRQEEKTRSDNPAMYVTSPKPGKRLPVVLNKEEVADILGTCITHVGSSNRAKSDFNQLRDEAIMQLLYASGLRRMEITKIKLAHVNFVKRQLRVIGKGNKERIVFFNDAAEKAMRAYLEVRPVVSDAAFFLGQHGRRMTPEQVGIIFKQFVDRSGIATHATPHVMRHSFATHLIEDGAHLNTVKDLLGHESLAVTAVYVNVASGQMRKDYDKIQADRAAKEKAS